MSLNLKPGLFRREPIAPPLRAGGVARVGLPLGGTGEDGNCRNIGFEDIESLRAARLNADVAASMLGTGDWEARFAI